MPVDLGFLSCGYCTHKESMVITGGGSHQVQFPALVGVIAHPKAGVILFDTGYARYFFEETRTFPASLYAKTTPVTYHEHEGAAFQLAARGIRPDDVKLVLLSHFHADHVGGAKDFPNARFVVYREAYNHLKPLNSFMAVKEAFLPGLLPADFESRAAYAEDYPEVPLPPRFAPFTTGFDLLGDGSVLGVALPGHAVGHYGILLDTEPNPSFLVADACWLSKAFRENLLPHPLANLIFSDPRAYRETVGKLHALHRADPGVRILPSHCQEVAALVQVPG